MRGAALLLIALLTPLPAAAQTTPPPVPASAPAPAPVPVYGFEVVRSFPHDPGAFTQGLAFRDGVLLESTGRRPSTVRRVRLEDGAVLQRRDLDPAHFGEGLTDIGDRVVTLTWTSGKAFVWDADDLEPRGEFAYAGEGWGLTDDGDRLILSDGTAALRFFDPETLAETGRVAVTLDGRPLRRINELEWIDGEVFANIWQSDIIVRIDPATGVVTGVIDLAGLMPDRSGLDPTDAVLNGIAWDAEGRRLFVTGKNWPTLFEIRLTEPR
ncbi:glutaminyl-peptide cyclotransferase [Brevundimonas sp.]|uniref:glutaminyl-peptide cyclotransferase n=1 Tax=Brevundimonas sp. TaxID=1871086 RepID=UPI0027378B58|nr:glutaminyl-peptide cyclotransferase [Brevundimonas sp.]MDP3802238.1 glutaminyl-peptide cyclotransferase [Brevundimonas sp.]